MDHDLFFVVGCIISVFAIPAVISAFSDGRAPRTPALVVLIGAGMIGYAMTQRPGAYSLETLPDVFVRVVGSFL